MKKLITAVFSALVVCAMATVAFAFEKGVDYIVIEETIGHTVYDVIGYSDSDFFSLRKAHVKGEYSLKLDGVYCGIYVLSGKGEFICNGQTLTVGSAEQYFIPAEAGDLTIKATSGEELVLLISKGPKI